MRKKINKLLISINRFATSRKIGNTIIIKYRKWKKQKKVSIETLEEREIGGGGGRERETSIITVWHSFDNQLTVSSKQKKSDVDDDVWFFVSSYEIYKISLIIHWFLFFWGGGNFMTSNKADENSF